MRFSIRIPDSPKQVAKRQERIAEERRKLRAPKQQQDAPASSSLSYFIERSAEEQAAAETSLQVAIEQALSAQFASALLDWVIQIAHAEKLEIHEFDSRPPTVMAIDQPFTCHFVISNGARVSVECVRLAGRRVKAKLVGGTESVVFNLPDPYA